MIRGFFAFLIGIVLAYAVMLYQPIRNFAYSWQAQFEQSVEQSQQENTQQNEQNSS